MAETTLLQPARRTGRGRIAVPRSGRLIFFLALLLALSPLIVSWSLSPSLPPQLSLCHSVTTGPVAPEHSLDLPYECAGKPSDYAGQWLWLRHRLSEEQRSWPDWSMNMHLTRFQDLVVHFHFADGTVQTDRVEAGDFDRHWTPNGYIAFNTHGDAAPLEAITLGINRLASYELIRLRLVPVAQQERAVQLSAALVGAALSFLTVSLFYNVFVAVMARRASIVWHCGWVVCMIAWGLFWSQLILIVAPGVAGTASVRVCSILAMTAICLASQYMLATLETNTLPAWIRVGLRLAAAVTLLLCLFSAFAPAGMATALANAFRLSTLLVLTGAIAALIVALCRGSRSARDFALAWSLPLTAVLASYSSDTSATVPVLSGEMMVLVTSALQTLWLSFAASRSFASLQAERDHARAMQSELMILAETDPLTKLYNRRGLTERFQRELAATYGNGSCLGLILIDLDHFKAVNDTFGHEVGDRVLQHVAGLLGSLRQEGAIVARFGGEEFCIVVPDKAGESLRALAEKTRLRLAEADLAAVFGTAERRITASFGVTDTIAHPGLDANALLREADHALYHAKAQGRNRIVVARSAGEPRPAAAAPV